MQPDRDMSSIGLTFTLPSGLRPSSTQHRTYMQKQTTKAAAAQTLLQPEAWRQGNRLEVTLVCQARTLHAAQLVVLPTMLEQGFGVAVLTQATNQLGLSVRDAQRVPSESTSVNSRSSPKPHLTKDAHTHAQANPQTLLHKLPFHAADEGRAILEKIHD